MIELWIFNWFCRRCRPYSIATLSGHWPVKILTNPHSFLPALRDKNIINLLLKVPSWKLYHDKYMIASTQITNTEIFTFITALVFRLLYRKVLFINRKDNRNCYKVRYFSKILQNSLVNYCKVGIVGMWTFQNTFENVSDHLPVFFQFTWL